MELGEHNVRVNSVSPGQMATGILPKVLGMEPGKADRLAGEMQQRFAKIQPIPRAGTADDIAQCVAWLASDRATFVNATDIVVDGGIIGGRQFGPHQAGLRQLKTELGL
jgi:NAD(P)-dependent dehydrogenase (short-subunit alcohol dehydrogenase family)